MQIRIAVISAGLGNISRGFEVSAEAWYYGLVNNHGYTIKLFSGGHKKNATKVWNVPRNSRMPSLLRRLKVIKDGARLEQITFSIGFLFHLFAYRPKIIWLQEGIVGNMLLLYRRIFGFKFKLLFCDGAPVGHEFAKRFDYIIFLHKYALSSAVMGGIDPQRCRVISHLSLFPEKPLNKAVARATMSIASEKFVVICVAAWNRHHKRIDYLLQEIAHLNSQEVVLLLCGQPEHGCETLKEMAKHLGIDVYWYTLNQKELSRAYAAADLFVLPSLNEGLGTVLIEAGAHKLPIICHPHAGGKYILGEDYTGFCDLSKSGTLSTKISNYIRSENLKEIGLETEQAVRKKFNREKLILNLVEFIKYISQE